VKYSSQLSVAGANPEYVRAWTFYRRLRFFVFSLFFGAMVELRCLFIVPAVAFALTFVVYFFLALWLANWKCPRCKQPFFRGAFLRSLFGGRCFHCDLPKWCVSETGRIIFSPRFLFGWKASLRTSR
jgi:hypothetical protein